MRERRTDTLHLLIELEHFDDDSYGDDYGDDHGDDYGDNQSGSAPLSRARTDDRVDDRTADRAGPAHSPGAILVAMFAALCMSAAPRDALPRVARSTSASGASRVPGNASFIRPATRPMTLPTAQPVGVAELIHDEPPAGAATAPPVSSLPPGTVWMEVTAYCPCAQCCGVDAAGVTASGASVTTNAGHFVAADTDLFPFGTTLSIPGYDESAPVPVLDRGSAIKANRIDVFFPTHEQALEWGRQWVAVRVVP